MLQKTYITLLFLLVAGGSAFAQKSDRDYLRSGNKLYNDSLFVKAEVDYRKALEVNPKSTDAMFNLGNSLLMQQKAKEAMQFAVDPNHWICCYPYGGVNDAVVELVRSQGAVAGFCTQVGIADLKRDHRYLLPRMDTNDYPPVSFFYKQI